MKNLKKLLVSIGLVILVFGIVYMCGVFYNATFNIVNWTMDSRECVSIVGGIFGLAAAALFIFFTAAV